MKRDMDLVRGILLEVEKAQPGRAWDLRRAIADGAFPGHDETTVLSHAFLMREAGLLEIRTGSNGSGEWKVAWLGHDFIDSARNDTVWERAKGAIREKGFGLSIELLKGVLSKLAKDALGLP
ncbi:hypothetical protein Pan44_53300 [Caulifigura coniformis]|uniref:DUF2513 domain-containing protein n=1 Tax=Caulifigura coniformis TaxID=2527983 RepID=A0A517SMB0_9PLAN|nr:DUF2513 domain-containing protein [Caulifigura coniformis]QDT57262.1 hypothetical protein Pan44_53300 [Caulifigura coniformis]